MLATLLQYVDTAMVGQLGQNATAAVSVTTTITWLVGSICSALGIATLSMISKAVGSGDRERIRRISSQVLMLAVSCGCICYILYRVGLLYVCGLSQESAALLGMEKL